MMLAVWSVLAAIIETQVWGASFYYLAVTWMALDRNIEKIIIPIVIGGILVDVLTPRALGVSALFAMTALYLGKRILSLDERSLLGRVYAVVAIAIEGIIFARGYGMIFVSISVYLCMILMHEMWGSKRSGIVVRREI